MPFCDWLSVRCEIYSRRGNVLCASLRDPGMRFVASGEATLAPLFYEEVAGCCEDGFADG